MTWTPDGPNLVFAGDNLPIISALPDAAFRLIYVDPPFNTGRTQSRQVITTKRSSEGTRTGFKGLSYDTIKGILYSYDDNFADYWEFLGRRLEQAWRLLDDRGIGSVPVRGADGFRWSDSRVDPLRP